MIIFKSTRLAPLLGIGLAACEGRLDACADSPPSDPPRIVFDAMGYDFGDVPVGGIVSHVFGFKNVGRRPLLIAEARSSSRATAAVLRQREIQPGAGGQIEVRFSADAAGPTRQIVTVRSNDPGQPQTALAVNAVVLPPLDYEPHYIKLISDDPERRAERVWFTGSSASVVKPAVVAIRGDGAGVKHLSARPIHAVQGASPRHGLEFGLTSRRLGSGAARVLVKTGLVDPAEITIELVWGESAKAPTPATS